jgi:hypothetical protein
MTLLLVEKYGRSDFDATPHLIARYRTRLKKEVGSMKAVANTQAAQDSLEA